MIERIEVTRVHATVDDDLEKYAHKKIGQLDRFTPRRARESLHAEIKLKEGKAEDKRYCTCEVILHLPHETLTTSESTINMYAAIDIVETKLIQQLKKYKNKYYNPKLYRRLLVRMKRS